MPPAPTPQGLEPALRHPLTHRPPLLALLALGLVTFGTTWVAVELSRSNGNIAAFWPANAILLGVLLRAPSLGLLLPIASGAVANLLLNLIVGDSLVISAGFAVANTLEVLCAYGLVARFAGLPMRLASLRELLVLSLGAGLAAPVAGATVGAFLIHHAFDAPLWTVWRTWWIRDAAGILLITPLIVAWDGGQRLRQALAAPRRYRAGLELAAAVGLLGAEL